MPQFPLWPLALPLLAAAQTGAAATPAAPATPLASPLAEDTQAKIQQAAAWQACTLLADDERLACFDQWAASQQKLMQAMSQRVAGVTQTSEADAALPAASATASVLRADVTQALASAQPAPAARDDAPEGVTASTGIVGVGLEQGCRDRQFSALSRFWELESGSACPTFSLRGYGPTGLSAAVGNRMNQQPASPNAANVVPTPTSWRKEETLLLVSVRTKIAGGLFTPAHSPRRDSLWFGYTQQSYWQLFSPEHSRPFRSTDYAPEAIYIYPTTASLPLGWRWRYTGAGLVHQSNGQSDPQSRSWNRAYLMAGFEHPRGLTVQAKLWSRFKETALNDNNPDITRYLGHSEIAAAWQANSRNLLRATFTGPVGTGRGSTRLEWLRALGNGAGNSFSGLHLHLRLFHGYGDSLLDYNYKRTVFSVGLSLLEF